MAIFETYKKFRNKFRELDLFDTLHTIWIKSKFNQFNDPLPDNLKIIQDIHLFSNPGKMEIMLYNGLDHELEIMLIEALYSCQEGTRPRHTLKNPKFLKKVLTDLRDFDSDFYKKTKLKSTNNIFRSLQRLAYQQFLWQEKMSSYSLFPYFYMYNSHDLKQIIENEFDLTPSEIYVLGLYFTYNLKESFQLNKNQQSDIPKIPTSKLLTFISEFSIHLNQLRQTVKESYWVDEKFLTYLNPLRAKPIIVHNDSILAPIPVLIHWAITKGIYYRIYKKKSFGNAFGHAFQDIIGEIVRRAIDNKKLELIPEKEYFFGKNRKDTVDWRLKDREELLFIECKTKRMTRTAQFSITQDDLLMDIKKMGEFLYQTYRSFIDFKNNLYPDNQYESTQKHRIVILTLEEWFISINMDDYPLIEEELKTRLKRNHPDVNLSIISEVPFYLIAMPTFVHDIQIINKFGLKKYFQWKDNNKLDETKNSFNFKDIFIEDFNDQFIKPFQ